LAQDLQRSLVQFLTRSPWVVFGVAVIGAVGLFCFYWGFASFLILIRNMILPGRSLKKYGAGGDCWAVVTGATEGLGKEFARQLAAKGFHVHIVGRNRQKLNDVAQGIQSDFQRKASICIIDFATAGYNDYARLESSIQDKDISVLINNVGVSHSIPVPFAEVDFAEISNIVTVNNMATLHVTSIVLKRLAKRQNGLILTIGSFAGLFPTPYLAAYSGSKAFLQNWSISLAAEMKPAGVDVEFILSYLVVSAMSKVRRPSLFVPSAKTFVKKTLGSLGLYGDRSFTVTPYWVHALMQWIIVKGITEWSGFGLGINLNMHAKIRNRALRKLGNDKKTQ